MPSQLQVPAVLDRSIAHRVRYLFLGAGVLGVELRPL